MTTLICDFQSIVGKKIKGYATLTAGQTRPAYDAPSVVVHDPIEKEVVEGRAVFENVNPGDAVITVDWEDQSSTIRFVVPNSEEDVYLSDCLTGDYFTPEEIDLLRWGIQEQISGARELIETAANDGMNGITGSVADYFTKAAEILRKALEAAQRAEQSLDTIDSKVEATEGVVTDVDQAKQQIQDLLDYIAALELELGKTSTDLAGAVGTINTISPQVSAAAQAASAATQKAQNAVNELNKVQNANAAEFNAIKQDLNSAVQTAKQATDAVAQTNQQLGIEVQRILGEVDVALVTATEATAQARIANENLETYQYQLGEIHQEQGHILSQQAEIVGSFEHQIAEIERLSAEISTAASEIETISGEQTALATEMNTQVVSLKDLTAAQGTAINAAKTQADKGVTDAAAASNALSSYKKVNDPKVTKAQQDATKGINNAATALAKANEANNKLPSITADVSAAAQTALEAVNALPGIRTDINDNNEAFQTWQLEVNNRRDIWEKASTDATKALARFAITQTQWNDISSKATNANTKAIASHAALFEGQNKWNEVAAAAIETQANFATKQLEWNAVQKKVNDNFQSWQNAATEMLTSTGKFQILQKDFNQKVKDWQDTQNKFNAQQTQLNAVSSKTDEAHSNALKGIQQILNMVYPAQSLVLIHPEKNIPVWEEQCLYNSNGHAYSASSVETADLPTGVSRAIKVTATATYGSNAYAFASVDPDIEYKYSFWAKASKTGTRLYIELRNQDGNHSIQTNTSGEGSPQGNTSNYLATNALLYTSWTKYSGTIKFRAGTQRVRIGTIYFNHSNGETGTQWLADIQITPNMPSQTAVDKAQNDALTALNRFAINQTEWNKVSTTATNANTAALAAKKVLDDNQNRWIQGANLAINNLQTFAADQKKWNQTAEEAQAAMELLIGVGDESAGSVLDQINELDRLIGDRASELDDRINNLKHGIWDKFHFITPDNPALGSSWFSVDTNVLTPTVTAKGTWVGMFILTAFGKRGGTLTDFRAVTSSARSWKLPNINSATSSAEQYDRILIDFKVQPGKAIRANNSVRDVANIKENSWHEIMSYKMLGTGKLNVRFNVGWHATTFGDYYGVRIMAGSTELARVYRNGVGPRTPFGNGYRTQTVGVNNRSVSAGTVISFQVYSSNNRTEGRKVRDAQYNLDYVY